MADNSQDRATFVIRIEDDSSDEPGEGGGAGGGGSGGGQSPPTDRGRQGDQGIERTNREIRNLANFIGLAATGGGSTYNRFSMMANQYMMMRSSGVGMFGGQQVPNQIPTVHPVQGQGGNKGTIVTRGSSTAGAQAGEIGFLLGLLQLFNETVGNITKSFGDGARTITRSVNLFTGALESSLTGSGTQGAFDLLEGGVGGFKELATSLKNVLPFNLGEMFPLFWVTDALSLVGEESLKVVKAFRRVIIAFEHNALELQKFNPNIAAAVARGNVSGLMNQVYEASALGAPMARMLDAQTRIDRSMNEFWVPVKRLFLTSVVPIMEKIAGFLERNSDMGIRIEESGKSILNVLEAFFTGGIQDAAREMNKEIKDLPVRTAKAIAEEAKRRAELEMPIDQFFRQMENEVNRMLRPDNLNDQWGNRGGEHAQPHGLPGFPIFRPFGGGG